MRRPSFRTLACAAAVLVASCFGDSTGPKAARRGHFAFAPVFAKTAVLAADFDRARVVLTPVGGNVASLDTVVTFPLTSPSLTLQLTLQITGPSEDFDLTVALFNSATGDTTYRGGPVRLTATATVPTTATSIPIVYVGPGAKAVSVRFAPPVPTAAYFGDTVTFTAQALDSSGAPIAGAPFRYAIDVRDTGIARVPDSTLGRVIAKSQRGQARVVATLITGLADTTPLAVQPRPAAIAVSGGNNQTALAGAALAQPVVFHVTAADNLAVTGVPVSFAVASGGGSLGAATGTTDVNGLVSVGWTLGATVGAQTMTATVTGLTPATATATATPSAPPIQMIFPGNALGVSSTLPLGIKLGQPAPAGGVVVTVTSDSTQYVTVASPGTVSFAAGDTLKTINITGVAYGASILHATASGYTAGLIGVVVTPNVIVLGQNVAVAVGQTANVSIQLVPAAPAGGLTVTLASSDTTKVKVTTPTVSIAAGVATGNATVQGVASGTVGITATAPSYTQGGTVVTAGVAGQAALVTKVAGDLQSAPAGAPVLVAPQVKVTDVLGAAVANVAVTFTVAAGGGSVTGATAQTDASGLAAVGSWTLGTTAGSNALTATVSGVTPVVFTATGTSGGIVSTTVTPKRDTVTAINGTFQLAAQAKDLNGNSVVGAFTWVSRKPSAVTVSPTGLVKGLVNNDSSWVVATESGGTRDSAIIVVVQKLASITVSPQTRSLYLGTTFNYTAQAVDGLGTPLASSPTLTWTTTAPAVASVDTAGHVSAIGLGSAQIKATSGTITGVANLSVLTPITKIVVAVDTTPPPAVPKTDTATLVSLGVTRRYHAYAYDTLNVLMPSVTQFTWASSNPSVAGIPNQTSDTVTATSAANGVTTIKATAQGFTSVPGALLTVSQVLAAIQLLPASATIAPSGSVALTARGLDANAHFISGGTFTYAASNGFATVGATTGLVTGVSVGADTITASSGAIVSTQSIVVVSNSVPAAISFGRDTVSVGRGSQASIPILLSTPVPAGRPGLTVFLGVSPAAYAHWSTPTVTIPTGGSSVNATLVGDSAGTTTVTATDTSTVSPYGAGRAVAKVTANMALTSASYYVNGTDIASTQVLLSDPSPAGGTYVTWQYGTAGVAAISPDPAYIPAGQLAADIQIRALAAGTTTITPQATGVNGAASTFTAYAPVLTIYPSYPPTQLLGLGQYYPSGQVSVPTYTNNALVVTLTSSDTTKVTVPATVTVPSGAYYTYNNFPISSVSLGRAAITPSAAGWTAGNLDSVIVTTPHVGICCQNTGLYTTSGTQYQYLYAEDSLGYSHPRTNSLLVNVRSSDTTVMKVIDTVGTIPPGASYVYGARVTPGGLGGTAYIVASASGHTPDSVLYTVQGPPLHLNWTSRLIGAGQQDINGGEVYVPNSVTAPLVVKLANTDSTRALLPDSVIIPTGTNYVYFTIKGLAIGTDTIRVTAPGYQTDSATVTVGRPAVILNSTSYTFNNYNAGSVFYIYSADTLRNTHQRIAPDTIGITVRDTTIAKVDSATAIIAAGSAANTNRHVAPVGVGSTYLVLTAGGGQVVLDSLQITVNTPPIQLYVYYYTAVLGRRQHMSPSYQGIQVYTPDSRIVAVPATITQKHATVDSLTTLSPTIAANTSSVYVDAFGLANGIDTLTVSATGYNSGSPAYVTVTTPKLGGASLPSTTTTTNLSPIYTNVSATDSIYGYSHYTMDTVTVHAVSSDTTVLKPDSAYYHILKNGYYVQTSSHVYGPGSAYLVFSDSANSGYLPDTTNTMTVTGPSLFFSPTSTVLGMRQTTGSTGAEVYTTNNVTQPLVVHLASTATSVVTVPDSVIIPTGTNYVYFPVNAMDTVGTIQVKATATGFATATMTVQVTHPKFYISTSSQLYTTSPRTSIYVYTEDANGTTHPTTDSVIVHLASSAPSVANIDSVTVTIPKGQYYTNLRTWGPDPGQATPGTAVLSATDTTAAFYAYTQATYNVSVVTPKLGLTWSTQTLGLGQYNSQYASSPNSAVAPIVITLAHAGTARTSTTVNGVAISVDTIPTSNSSTGYFHVVGTAVGTDTLVVSASSPPFINDTGYTAVSQGHVDQLGNWPSTLSLSTNDSVLVYLYARDSTLSTHYVQDSTTFTLLPSGNIEFVSGGATSTVITSVVIPKDAYYVQFYVKGTGTVAGSGSAQISATNYVTYTTPTITVNP